jgi:hypothetical protein
MSALNSVKDVTGASPAVEEKDAILKSDALAGKVEAAVDEGKELLKKTLKQATDKLVESNKKVARLETSLTDKTVKSIIDLLSAILQRQENATADLETRMTTIRDTSLGNPITPSLELYTASFGSLSKEIPNLLELFKKIEEAQGKLVSRINPLEWGAKVESFAIALETLKGKINVPTQDSLDSWKREYATLKSTFDDLKKDIALASNESLSAKLIPLWNNSVLELHRIEKLISLKLGELILANLSSHLGEFVKLKDLTAQKLKELSPETFDPKAVSSFFPMDEVKTLLQFKTSYRGAFKNYTANGDFANELYYFPGTLGSHYAGESKASLEAHKSMLDLVSKELSELKVKLDAEWNKIKAAAIDAGTTLDRIYEAANNKGTALSSAAWLAYGSNAFKNAFKSPEKYLTTIESQVAAFVKATEVVVTPEIVAVAEPVTI